MCIYSEYLHITVHWSLLEGCLSVLGWKEMMRNFSLYGKTSTADLACYGGLTS